MAQELKTGTIDHLTKRRPKLLKYRRVLNTFGMYSGRKIIRLLTVIVGIRSDRHRLVTLKQTLVSHALNRLSLTRCSCTWDAILTG